MDKTRFPEKLKTLEKPTISALVSPVLMEIPAISVLVSPVLNGNTHHLCVSVSCPDGDTHHLSPSVSCSELFGGKRKKCFEGIWTFQNSTQCQLPTQLNFDLTLSCDFETKCSLFTSMNEECLGHLFLKYHFQKTKSWDTLLNCMSLYTFSTF